MPGELSNCIAGRVANLFNLHGPNFTVDAACASALAAMDAAVEGLRRARVRRGRSPAASTATWAPSTFVKFCAIGALSRDRHAPVRRRRRRLRDGRGRGAVRAQAARRRRARRRPHLRRRARRRRRERRQGQGHHRAQPGRPAVRRRARLAQRGLSPAACTLDRGPRHVDARRRRRRAEQPHRGVRPARPGAAGRSRSARSSRTSATSRPRRAPRASSRPRSRCTTRCCRRASTSSGPTPTSTGRASPFAVNTELRDWEVADGATRVAGVSAFGFGGTNFHVVMEEHVPGHLTHQRRIGPRSPCRADVPRRRAAPARRQAAAARRARARRRRRARRSPTSCGPRWPRRARAATSIPPPPSAAALRAPERIAIDYADGARPGRPRPRWRCARCRRATRRPGRRCARAASTAAAARRARSRSSTPARARSTRTCSRELRAREPVVADLFDEADAIMAPLLEGRRLSDIVFADPADPARWRGPRRSCAARRSRSRRCSPSTSRSRACSASTGSRPTWSWATRSASTARWWRPARCRSRTRSRP